MQTVKLDLSSHCLSAPFFHFLQVCCPVQFCSDLVQKNVDVSLCYINDQICSLAVRTWEEDQCRIGIIALSVTSWLNNVSFCLLMEQDLILAER